MSSISKYGILIEQQDLSTVSSGSEDDGRLYNHDGTSSITLTSGSTTSDAGYYIWNNSAGAWDPTFVDSGDTTDADTLDGLDSTQFIRSDQDGTVEASHVVPPYLRSDQNGEITGDFNVTGQASEKSDRIATRQWVNNNTGGSSSSEVGNLSIANWEVIDVGNHGFPGDRTGGDLAQFIADQITAGGKYVFVLPNGTYNWERPLSMDGGTGTHDEPMPESFAIIGKPDATLYGNMPTGSERLFFRFGTSSNGFHEACIENIHFDVGYQSDTRDAGIMRAYIGDEAHFEDLTLSARKRLQSDGTKNGDRFCIKCDCVNDDATAVLKNIRLKNGDVFQGADLSVGHAIPLASEPPHVGTNHWIDCYVEDFIDNGYYVRDGQGSNYLTGCVAKNNAAGQFRLGRNDYAENIKAVTTSDCEYNSTPIWIQEYRDVDDQSTYTPGDENDSPCVVSGFEILAEGGPVNDVIRVNENPPEVLLESGYIRNRVDEYIFDATSNSGKVTIRDVTVDDHASGDTRLAAIHASMDNVSIENLTYRANPASTENGRSLFWVDGVDRFSVKDSDLQCSYYPLFEVESSSELTMKDCRCENTSSSAYVMRLQSTPVERVTLRYNDFLDYSDLYASTTDMNRYHIVGNDGVADADSGN